MNSDKHNCQVFHFDLYGTREEKYDYLNTHSLSDVAWEELNPQEPQCFFAPKDFELQEEYERGFKVEELIPIYTSGVKTSNDEELTSKKEFNLPTNRIYFFRPFDVQFINYDFKKVGRPRYNVMKHFEKDNLGLLICKQAATEKYGYFVTKGITDINYTGTAGKFGAGLIFPLYIYKENMGTEERVPNLSSQIVKSIEQSLGEPVEPLALFDYIYAVLHSPGYRERYKEFLKIDFPRIPYPADSGQYHRLAEKGAELRRLHLMEDLPQRTGVSFPASGTMQVDGYRWQENRVYINSEQYFEGVPASAWNFYIGGYQPAQKWLKDRKGTALSFEDVKHYQRIVYVLQQTERIMQEIDGIMSKAREYAPACGLGSPHSYH